MQKTKGTQIEIRNIRDPVWTELVALAKHMDARIMTNDFNLNKVAASGRRGDQPERPGDGDAAGDSAREAMGAIRSRGRSTGRGGVPGRRHDGGGGVSRIGQTVTISVTNAMQTSAGRMIFGQIRAVAGAAGGGERKKKSEGSGLHRAGGRIGRTDRATALRERKEGSGPPSVKNPEKDDGEQAGKAG